MRGERPNEEREEIMAETDSEKGGKPGLLARIRSKLFGAGKVPEKTQMLISGVESVEELRFALRATAEALVGEALS